jgi:carboxyl-terminal processing protease
MPGSARARRLLGMLRLTGRVLHGTVVVVAVVCAYGAGIMSGAGPMKRTPPAIEPALLDEAAGRIVTEAAVPVPRGELERAAINAMLHRLGDRWAHYYTAQEYDDVQGRLNGRYSGVGLWLGAANGSAVRVASVQPGSAAAKAGVRVGDVIVAVSGVPATGWTVTKVAMALRGQSVAGVGLTVRRGAMEHRFQLVRSQVRTTDVTVEQRPGHVRLIQIGAFTRGVGRQVRSAVTADLPGHAGGIVLDLRGNPGGLLDEAVDTTSAFLANGPVVTYEKRGRAPQRFDVTAPGDAKTPLVVLVDAGTASAAEIVAGSLSDRERAVIVGSRTFGKGSVQEPVRLGDGSALELTVGRYRTPGGRNLDGVGIDPDVAISSDRPFQVAEQRALAVLHGLLATLPTKDRG